MVYFLLGALLVFSLVYSRVMQRPLYRCLDRHLAEAQYEHARWVAICLEMTKNRCDVEAKIAAEQVVVLRAEINFYRRTLARLRQPRVKRA